LRKQLNKDKTFVFLYLNHECTWLMCTCQPPLADPVASASTVLPHAPPPLLPPHAQKHAQKQQQQQQPPQQQTNACVRLRVSASDPLSLAFRRFEKVKGLLSGSSSGTSSDTCSSTSNGTSSGSGSGSWSQRHQHRREGLACVSLKNNERGGLVFVNERGLEVDGSRSAIHNQVKAKFVLFLLLLQCPTTDYVNPFRGPLIVSRQLALVLVFLYLVASHCFARQVTSNSMIYVRWYDDLRPRMRASVQLYRHLRQVLWSILFYWLL
jgi:hypothetical protein